MDAVTDFLHRRIDELAVGAPGRHCFGSGDNSSRFIRFPYRANGICFGAGPWQEDSKQVARLV